MTTWVLIHVYRCIPCSGHLPGRLRYINMSMVTGHLSSRERLRGGACNTAHQVLLHTQFKRMYNFDDPVPHNNLRMEMIVNITTTHTHGTTHVHVRVHVHYLDFDWPHVNSRYSSEVVLAV